MKYSLFFILFILINLSTNAQSILSNSNKTNFISTARAAFNKFGFDIPKGKEESFITAYEVLIRKPLNNQTIGEFIDNLNRFTEVKGSEQNKNALTVFYKAMTDKQYENVEEFRAVGAATKPSIFISAVAVSQSVYDLVKDAPGMEKAAKLLKNNIVEGNKSNEYMVARNGKAYPVINEYIVENLVQIDSVSNE